MCYIWIQLSEGLVKLLIWTSNFNLFTKNDKHCLQLGRIRFTICFAEFVTTQPEHFPWLDLHF